MLTRIVSIFLLWSQCHVDANIRDETEVFACHDEAIQIQCRRRESTVAVYAATFVTLSDPGGGESQCDRRKANSTATNVTCTDDVRLVVNKRCSGMSSCNFLVADLVPRECYGAGVFSLTYGCVSVSDIVKYCNVQVEGSTAEGLIHNPGYPNYYPGLTKCTWTIKGDVGQRVLLSVLDMSLQPNHGQSAVDCRDSLQIYDGLVKVFHACGWGEEYLLTIHSNANVVRVVFNSQDVWPSRGVLLYYRVLGCATLPAPMHGYLVYRNASMAHYMCCARHVFVDDYRRNRILYCQDGNKWNGTVSSCRHVKLVKEWTNSSGAEFEEDGYAENDPIRQVAPTAVSIIYDIVIPSVIMAAMVISNIFIVLIILRLRRAKQREAASASLKAEEEMAFQQQQQQPSTSKQQRNGASNGSSTAPHLAPLAPDETGV